MKPYYIFFLIFLSTSFFSLTKNLEQTMADSMCVCLGKFKQKDLSPQEKQKALVDCAEEARKKNMELAMKEENLPKERTDEAGRQYGTEVAKKTFIILTESCRTMREWMGIDK